MNTAVAVRRVADYKAKVRVKSDDTGVDMANMKMSVNPLERVPEAIDAI